ncbi:MAG: GMC family oxidoreductase [Myxococcota bacterium]|nr:GMC family oxidoreductase [Myxococcota bacterium]
MSHRSAADVPDGFHLETEICVIGSGAGGGLAAGYLAEQGHSVVLLEEGQRVTASQMTQREEQMYPLLYRDGGSQMTADGGISVLQGRAVGGSTVINMADVVPIPPGVVQHWAQRFGVDRFSQADWDRAAGLAKAAIGANLIPADQLNDNARILLRGGQALGVSGAAFQHNRVGCIGSGYCLVGCAYDAKKGTHLTWIPRGLATGNMLLQSQARVTRLTWGGGRVRLAHGHLVDAQQRSLRPFTVKAERYILAAGAIHSPLILQASKLGGAQVGKHLSLQPQAPVSARFPQPVRMFRGIPQAAYLDGMETCTAEQGLGGFRIESVSATPGMAAASGVGWGPGLLEQFRAYDRLAAALCLVPDRPVGEVRLSGGRPVIAYPFGEETKHRLRSSIRLASEVFLSQGAECVFAPLVGLGPITSSADLELIDRAPLRPASIQLISAHPQGTCRMGPDPDTSVVDLDFRVHGVENLQVLDASVFPTTASSHTMLPVMQAALLGCGA